MIQERKRRSVTIPPDTLKKIRKAIRSFNTMTEAQEVIGVHRNALERVILKNTCAPDTLNAIRTYLQSQSKKSAA